MQHTILTMADIFVRYAPEAGMVAHTGAGAQFHE